MYAPILALTLAMVSSAPSFAIAPPAPAQPIEAICPVTGKVIPPGQGVMATAKGREYRVFDGEAALLLQADPDKYLESDGTPRNAPRKEGSLPPA